MRFYHIVHISSDKLSSNIHAYLSLNTARIPVSFSNRKMWPDPVWVASRNPSYINNQGPQCDKPACTDIRAPKAQKLERGSRASGARALTRATRTWLETPSDSGGRFICTSLSCTSVSIISLTERWGDVSFAVLRDLWGVNDHSSWSGMWCLVVNNYIIPT